MTAPSKSAARRYLPPAGLAGLGLVLYVATLAPSLVFGDPAEYILIPHLGGILHPPGYAFMTVLAAVWQTLVPIGSLAYRSNLLSAAAGSLAGFCVYLSVRHLRPSSPQAGLASLLGGLSFYTASDVWQHSLHANAHIVTAGLASAALWLLLAWRASGQDRWLYGFGLVAGLSITHHPLLVFGFPAYGVYLLSQLFGRGRPVPAGLKRLAIAGGMAVLGLAPWLYFPIRSSLQPAPPFGPHDMNTVDGFLNLVLARGLTNVNLFHFGLSEQWHRLLVFWDLAGLQFAWPVLLLAGLGLVWLVRRDPSAAVLLGLHAAFNLAFTLNSVQDVMAYLLVPLVSLSMLIGAGILALAEAGHRRWGGGTVRLGLGLFLLFPLWNAVWLFPRISLRDLHDADTYVQVLADHFRGRGEHAVLLSDWEHMTPLWYKEYVDGLRLDPADVSVVYVNKPFTDAVWENVDKGPVYLLEYNPAVAALGFRLRAEGPFYRLVPPPATAQPPIPHPLQVRYGPISLLGYDVLTTATQPGGSIPMLVYMKADAASDHIVYPYATLGSWEYRFSTDSHLLSPYWQAGEVIVERWEMAVPLDAPAGGYPLILGFSDLTTGEDLPGPQSLGTVTVQAAPGPAAPVGGLAANFGQRIGLERAWAWTGPGVSTWSAPWQGSLPAKTGQSIEVRLAWRALQSMPESYTVFVHLLAADNSLVESKDYTPLGGAWPTMLWFPKWLPGQTASDPYVLTAPADPGDYVIEVGLYGLRSVQRLAAYDDRGNLAGDRFVLGTVTVTR